MASKVERGLIREKLNRQGDVEELWNLQSNQRGTKLKGLAILHATKQTLIAKKQQPKQQYDQLSPQSYLSLISYVIWIALQGS